MPHQSSQSLIDAATHCAYECERCATECEKHADKPHCQKCAEACRQAKAEYEKVATVAGIA